MAALVAIKENNKFSYIWVGEYGEIGTLGKTLRKYYNEEKRVRELINFGSVSNVTSHVDKIQINTSELKITNDFDKLLKERTPEIMFGYYFDTEDKIWYVYEWLNLHEKIERRKLDDAIIERFLEN